MFTYEYRLATNYAFIVDSHLDAIDAEYRRLLADPKSAADDKGDADLPARTRRIIESLDERGAWVERGRLKHHRVEPESGVIASQTFADNVRVLCRYIAHSK